eukprot:jgi/Undpi1/3459/HiC_scaffold_16.g06831.m1
MAPMKSLYFAVGITAAAAAASAGPSSSVYSLQGGGSGMEQGGDYMENKIARGLHGVFGAAADEAKHANKHIKGAAKSARESVKIGRPFEGKGEVVKAPSKLSWVGGAAPEPVKEKHPMCKFLSDPNHAFVAQGIVACVFGGLHILKYDEFSAKLAEPLCNLIGVKFGAVTAVLPHVKLVGAYLVGVLVSDVLAYKSNSAGFKRGKVWHEMGTGIALSLVCIKELLSSDVPADMVPHCVAAVVFAAWYTFLSREY